MKASRLLTLLLLLQTRQRMTTGELAERLEVSRRTVLRDVEAVADQGAKTPGEVVGAAVEFTAANGVRQLRLVGEAEFSQRVGGLPVGVDEQLSLDHAQRVGRDPGVEVDLPGGRCPDVGLDEFGDRGNEFSRGGAAIAAAQEAGASTPRST